jgi:hypothetical protein
VADPEVKEWQSELYLRDQDAIEEAITQHQHRAAFYKSQKVDMPDPEVEDE